jgi:hypothetical protein
MGLLISTPITAGVRGFSLGWRAALCGLFALAVLPVQAASRDEYAGETARWRRYQSPHFELFSANDDRASRDLLHDLELFRAMFLENFKLKERQPLEVTIYYFSRKDDFFNYVTAAMRGNENLAGYYLSQPDRATIVVSPMWDDESARHVIFHEYVHHLIRVGGDDPPLWLNEGIAELYSSVEIRSDTMEIGKPLPWHVRSLRQENLLPLDVLFSVDHASPIYNTGTHTGQFYAESWALLHFWFFGKSTLDREKVRAFMHSVGDEKAAVDPALRRRDFQKMMGMDYPAMQDLLERYARSGSYSWRKVPLPKIDDAKSYKRREMALAETREQLAELDLRANQSGRARLAFLRTVDQVPFKTRRLEVLGSDAWAQGEADRAREQWGQAIERGSNNPAIFHEVGLMESKRWFNIFDYYFRMPDELSTRLRLLLKRSIACAPEQTDAYEMLAWVEASAKKPDIANVNLVQHQFPSLVQKGPTLAALAMVRVHLDDWAAALTILDQADATKPGEALAQVIRIVRSHRPPVRAPELAAPPPEANAAIDPVLAGAPP